MMLIRRLSLGFALLPWMISTFCLTATTSYRQQRHSGTTEAQSVWDDAHADRESDAGGGRGMVSAERSRGTIASGGQDVQADDWIFHTTSDGDVVLVTDKQQADVVLTPASHIQLGTVTFTSTGAIKGEKGDSGHLGVEGRRGDRGIPGPVGVKGEPGDRITMDGPLYVNFATTSDTCTESDVGRIRIDEIGESLEICTGRGWRNLGSGNRPRKLRRSCLELLFIDGITEDGLYWINPSYGKDTQHAVRAYCDMSTAGGGWTLVAKVTDDFRWICPERMGGDCELSLVDPLRANLFHQVHERDLVDLHGRSNATESGVHVDNSAARYIFKTGRKHVRFSFVSDTSTDAGWRFTEDAYAAFRADVEQVLFKDGTWALYSRENLSYTWNVIRHERTHLSFTGDVICWGNRVTTPYRYHEGGLHMGIASSSLPCQLAIDPNAVMLKSIYAAVGENGNSQWVEGQRSYLGDGSMAANNERVAIWVR